MLTDTGPILALCDRADEHHDRCVAALEFMSGRLVTILAAVTEAIHLAGVRVGWRGQRAILTLIERGDLVIAPLDAKGLTRCRTLMERYRNVPMDFADATLMVIAEQQGFREIFTLDADFRIYRTSRGRALRVLPAS